MVAHVPDDPAADLEALLDDDATADHGGIGAFNDGDQALQGAAVGQKVIDDEDGLTLIQISLGDNDLVLVLVGEGLHLCHLHITVPGDGLGLLGENQGNTEFPGDKGGDADAVLEDMTGTEDLTGMEEYLDNPPQEDGSFLITAGGDTVRVMVPEAYTVMESGEDAVVGVADNFYDTVYYMLYADMTAEDMEAMFNEELVWARENEWYGSHTEPAELNGYTTMGLVYNDDTSIWYAWRELNGSFLLVVAEADAVTFDLEGLLATVEIPA